MPRVSVVMPVRNGAAWIEAACRSVLAQTAGELELIVIDDGSTDASASIVGELAAIDARLICARQPARGLVAALETGLGLARAPLLARLDADDIAMPQRLARQIDEMDRRADLALLGTWGTKIDGTGREIGSLRPPTTNHALQALLQTRNPFVHSTIMTRTALVRHVGGYREAARGAEDYDLWLRIAEQGEIDILPEALVHYRVHAGSVTRRHAVRQSFSARIARRAAVARRSGKPDPLAGLTAEPDWWSDGGIAAMFSCDARLCRLLDLADRDLITPERLARLTLPAAGALANLIHAEKRLLRQAVVNLLRTSRRPNALSTAALAGLLAASFVGGRR